MHTYGYNYSCLYVVPDPQAHCVRPVKMNAICSNLVLLIILRSFSLLHNYLKDTILKKRLSNETVMSFK